MTMTAGREREKAMVQTRKIVAGVASCPGRGETRGLERNSERMKTGNGLSD
jgi:hypothetical protein